MNFPSITKIKNSGVILQKKYGQNFLVDSDIAGRIVDIAGISENDFVIEIGTGMGALTCFLLRTGAKILSFEIDKKICSFLTNSQLQDERLTIQNSDFLKADISSLIKENSRCVLFGNIPYSITKDILFKVLKDLKYIRKALFVMQKEVAEKITAYPCSKEYSSISVLFGAYTFTKKHFIIPAKHFYPSPKVDSVFVEILPSNKRQWESEKEDFFRRVVKASFSQRRKKLYNNLKNFLIQNGLKPELVKQEALKKKIDLDKRAEEISCEVFYDISDIIIKLAS